MYGGSLTLAGGYLVPRAVRFVGAGEQAERLAALGRLGKQPVDILHVRVFPAAKILKRKHIRRIDVRLARLRHAVSQRPQMMHDTPDVRIRPRMIRPSAALHRV